MAPSWLNLSAHLNKSNVGRVPAAFFSSLSSLSSWLLVFLIFAIFIILLFIPLLREGCLPFPDDDDGSANVFARHLKRLLEIAIMLSILPLAASQFFRKA